MRQNYDEIASFHRDLYDSVIRKLFVLMAIILELPEDYLVNAHAYDKRSDDHLRYMIYNTRTQEEWDKAQAVTTGGHTDFGSLTLLFSQHIAGLQIRTPEEEWKWVKPVEGGITCNAADTLSFLTNGNFSQYPRFYRNMLILSSGFIKSTIHRVVTPPKDQIQTPRLGLLYFARPGDDTIMKTVPSPLLERLGLLTEAEKNDTEPAPTGTEYVRARVRDVHHRKVIDRRENTSFEFKGLKVPNYYK